MPIVSGATPAPTISVAELVLPSVPAPQRHVPGAVQAQALGGVEKPEAIAERYRAMDKPVFRPSTDNLKCDELTRVDGYTDLQAYEMRFLYNKASFIWFTKTEDMLNGKHYAGDKLHLSVEREQLPQAFDALSDLLLSEDSPVSKWKVINPEVHRSLDTEKGRRLELGGQIIFYLYAEKRDEPISADRLLSTRAFVDAVEDRLKIHHINPGLKPESDVSAHHWDYTSYRNDKRSDRYDIDPTQHQRLREEPVFQALSL